LPENQLFYRRDAPDKNLHFYALPENQLFYRRYAPEKFDFNILCSFKKYEVTHNYMNFITSLFHKKKDSDELKKTAETEMTMEEDCTDDEVPIGTLIQMERNRIAEEARIKAKLEQEERERKLEKLNLMKIISDYLCKNRQVIRQKIRKEIAGQADNKVIIWENVHREYWYQEIMSIIRGQSTSYFLRDFMESNNKVFLNILGGDEKYYLTASTVLPINIYFQELPPPQSYYDD
jgi:hypothetical protein